MVHVFQTDSWWIFFYNILRMSLVYFTLPSLLFPCYRTCGHVLVGESVRDRYGPGHMDAILDSSEAKPLFFSYYFVHTSLRYVLQAIDRFRRTCDRDDLLPSGVSGLRDSPLPGPLGYEALHFFTSPSPLPHSRARYRMEYRP